MNKEPHDYNQSRLHSLLVYCYYRVFISTSLLAIYIGRSGLQEISFNYPNLYFYSACSYLLTSVASLFVAHQRRFQSSSQAFFHACSDIVALTVLMHASGGHSNDFPILMLVSVAAGNILVTGRKATFIAAFATLCVLYEQFYNSINSSSSKGFELFQAGSLGIAFFATALITQQLAKRLKESEQLAKQRGADLAELEQLNHIVIQRMRTGIIALNEHRSISLINSAALELLGSPDSRAVYKLKVLSEDIQQALEKWQENPDYRPPTFRAKPNTPELLCNFTRLDHGEQPGILVFLEDQSQLAQQAQQLKLASLGTLTAGIAHEIRNPLGAISHAAQLLQESEALTKADARLADIIQQHSIRMNKIVENVLQLSRRKRTIAERISLKSFLQQFIEELRQSYSNTIMVNLSLHRDFIEARIDSDHLSQILNNLCQNALRYSENRTGKPEIKLEAGLLDNTERPFISVIDYGDGITPEDAAHIFEPFFTTSASGTGLGLYIAKELSEANEARLDYISIKEGGCFRLTFPHPERIYIRSNDDKTDPVATLPA